MSERWGGIVHRPQFLHGFGFFFLLPPGFAAVVVLGPAADFGPAAGFGPAADGGRELATDGRRMRSISSRT